LSIRWRCAEIERRYLDNWSLILSGKPFSTFSMARLKTLQFHLTLTPLFTATHTLFFLSFTIFFSWSAVSGVFGLFSWDPKFMAHIDSPWFVKFSKMANINFRESWFGFYIDCDLWPEPPPFLLKFSSIEKVF
jgi:hypothetical protein